MRLLQTEVQNNTSQAVNIFTPNNRTKAAVSALAFQKSASCHLSYVEHQLRTI